MPIEDASACYNINSLVDFTNQEYIPNERSITGLKKLLELLKYNGSEIDEFIDQMIDWIDKDSQPRNYGLEDYYYTGPRVKSNNIRLSVSSSTSQS